MFGKDCPTKNYQKTEKDFLNFIEKNPSVFFEDSLVLFENNFLLRKLFVLYNRLFLDILYYHLELLFTPVELNSQNMSEFKKNNTKLKEMSTLILFRNNLDIESSSGYKSLVTIWNKVPNNNYSVLTRYMDEAVSFLKGYEKRFSRLKVISQASVVPELQNICIVYDYSLQDLVELCFARQELVKTFRSLKDFTFFNYMLVQIIWDLDQKLLNLVLEYLRFLEKYCLAYQAFVQQEKT